MDEEQQGRVTEIAEAMRTQFGEHGCFFCEEPGNVFSPGSDVFRSPKTFNFLKWASNCDRKCEGCLSGKLGVRITTEKVNGQFRPSKEFRKHVHDPMELLPYPSYPDGDLTRIAVFHFRNYTKVDERFAPEIQRYMTEEQFKTMYPDAIDLLVVPEEAI